MKNWDKFENYFRLKNYWLTKPNPWGAANDIDVKLIKTNKDLMFALWNPGIEWFYASQMKCFYSFDMTGRTQQGPRHADIT